MMTEQKTDETRNTISSVTFDMDMKIWKNQFVMILFEVRDGDREEEVSLINNLQEIHGSRQKDLED